MIKKIKEFCKLSNEDIVLIVLALMSFSFGIWINYRQLWLQNVGFDLKQISKLLSVALICSAIIVFFISFFSTRVKLKNVIMLSIVLRAISLLLLSIFNVSLGIKASMLLCIMCECIFSVAFYPFLSTINKSNETYQKHILINYFSKDIAVIFCGLMIGVTLGKVVFSYGTCLFLTLIFTLLSGIVLLLYEENKTTKKKNILPFNKAFKNLYKSRNTNMYLIGQFISEIASALIFGMIMLLLTNYLKFEVSTASIFIILSNMVGFVVCAILNKHCKKVSVRLSVIIKYGTRSLMYILAIMLNSISLYILAILVAYISVRVFDDKVNGSHIRSIKTDSQFLFGNIRYFVLCIADGIGIFLAGIIMPISLQLLFICATILTIISIFIYTMLCKVDEKKLF